MAKSTGRQFSNKNGKSGHIRSGGKGFNTNQVLIVSVGLLVVALIAFGMIRLLNIGQSQGANASTLQADGLEVTGLDEGRNQSDVSQAEVTDRESRYLGPPSDPATLALAEAGGLEQPTLVWFYADWCQICQHVKPDVVDLGEAYDGQIKIVRLNVDHHENLEALRRYGVRATPTFVLLDAEGQLRGNVPGWPGRQAFSGAFDTLLSGG